MSEHAVVFKIAVSIAKGSALVFEISECEMDSIREEITEYGGHLDDLFYNGSDYPNEPGVYAFIGNAKWVGDGFNYYGEFVPIANNLQPDIKKPLDISE